MSFIKRILVSILVLCLAGCGTTETAYRAEALAPVSVEATGYLLASIGIRSKGKTSSTFGFNRLLFRQIGTNNNGVIEFSNSEIAPSKVAFKTEDEKIGSVAISLRPGGYEFYNVDFYYNNGQVEKTFKSVRDFTVPFTIKAGEALYLGEFIAGTVWGKGLMGLPIPAGGYFNWSNKSQRDLDFIKANNPVLEGYKISSVDLDLVAPYLVRSEK